MEELKDELQQMKRLLITHSNNIGGMLSRITIFYLDECYNKIIKEER